MSSNNDGLNLPWKIYFFNEDGKYHPIYDVMTIKTQEEMGDYADIMRVHNLRKLEIRVCDSLDYCLMHWKDGERIFPK